MITIDNNVLHALHTTSGITQRNLQHNSSFSSKSSKHTFYQNRIVILRTEIKIHKIKHNILVLIYVL